MNLPKSHAALYAFLAALLVAGGGRDAFADVFQVPALNGHDMVYNDVNQTLYISSIDEVLRYHFPSRQFLSSIPIPHSYLLGIDISPDRSTIAVGDIYAYTSSTSGFHLINTASNAVTNVFVPKVNPTEEGTTTAVFLANGKILVSPNRGYPTGRVRLYDPNSATTTVLSAQEGDLLAISADRNSAVSTTSGISPIGEWLYKAGTQSTTEGGASPWFKFELAINRNGSQIAVPTYGGTYIYNSNFQLLGILGHYATDGPIGVVYSPTSDVLYAAWWDENGNSRQIRAFSTTTLQQIGTFDAFGNASGNWNFPYNNYPFWVGRLRISPDGNTIFADIGYDISVIRLAVPEPCTLAMVLLTPLLCCIRMRCSRRKMPQSRTPASCNSGVDRRS